MEGGTVASGVAWAPSTGRLGGGEQGPVPEVPACLGTSPLITRPLRTPSLCFPGLIKSSYNPLPSRASLPRGEKNLLAGRAKQSSKLSLSKERAPDPV